VKRREAWVELPTEYEGFKFRVWLNAPSRLWTELTGESEAASLTALRSLVLEHNGWRDEEGQPYPPASEARFWEEIPTELAACVLVATQVEMQKLPNSMAPQRRRSKRG
jgi:hypothetical protein